MNQRAKSGLLILAITAVAISGFFATETWLRRPHTPEDMHRWIHRQLEITPEQEHALEPTERRFAARHRDLTERIRLGNMELAQAMLDAKGASPRVNAAIETIHQAQAQVQLATIEHVFEMRASLQPEQYEKLLNLTANALYDTRR